MSEPQTVLLSASEADIVRAALDQECHECYVAGWPVDELIECGSQHCIDGKRPASPVYLVVEGDRKHCSFHFPGAYERYTQEYGVVDTGTADCVCSWSPPSRWAQHDGQVATLTVFVGDQWTDVSHASRRLATATVRVLPTIEALGVRPPQSSAVEVVPAGGAVLRLHDGHHGSWDSWTYHTLTLPTVPRPGIDWVVRLDLQEGPPS